MKLWLITRHDVDYDEAEAFVIRAPTEGEARVVASRNGENEDCREWLNEEDSSCVEVTYEGEPGVILEHAVWG